jgi:osmotically-inducible protein OsmY
MERQKLFREVALSLAVAGLLSFASPAAALDDATLQQKLEARLKKAQLDRDANVRVSVKDGRATLAGIATTLEARRDALKAARKETGEIDDRIELRVEPRPDRAVLEGAADAILRYPRYTVFDSVGVAVRDGVVTLQGSVREPYRKDEIEDRVAEVKGVREIRNEIEVQPLSISDDRLRAELLRGIYGSELFDRFAYWADPPVRIIVANGHVTLTGYVNSPVERQVVGSIARETLAFGVDNQVQLESERDAGQAKVAGS